MPLKSIRFIEEPIEVQFERPPVLEKKPECPTVFTWRGETYPVIEMLAEWHDYTRRGRAARNMQPQHAVTAAQRGSWGVGAFYFQVRTCNGQLFEIYYDRSPQDVDHRKGVWFLYKELIESPDSAT